MNDELPNSGVQLLADPAKQVVWSTAESVVAILLCVLAVLAMIWVYHRFIKPIENHFDADTNRSPWDP